MKKEAIIPILIRITIYVVIGGLLGYIMLETEFLGLVPEKVMQGIGIAYLAINAFVFFGVIPLFLYGCVSFVKGLRKNNA